MKWRSGTLKCKQRRGQGWQAWFAWYPVKLDEGEDEGMCVWLEHVERRWGSWWYYRKPELTRTQQAVKDLTKK